MYYHNKILLIITSQVHTCVMLHTNCELHTVYNYKYAYNNLQSKVRQLKYCKIKQQSGQVFPR